MRSILSGIKTNGFTAAILLVLFWIPFNARTLIGHVTQGFDEYQSLFIYGDDLLLFAALLLLTWRLNGYWRFPLAAGISLLTLGIGKYISAPHEQQVILFLLFSMALFLGSLRASHPRDHRTRKALILFLLTAGISVIWAFNVVLALAAFARLLTYAAFFLLLGIYLRGSKEGWLHLFIVLATTTTLQTILGLVQFYLQHSIGLSLLGEPQLGPGVPGVARVLTSAGRLVRSYGTLPHANIYAAVIALGIMSLVALWLLPHKENKRAHLRIAILSGALFLHIAALIISFSRAGWISTAAGLTFVGAFLLWQKRFEKEVFLGIIALLMTLMVLILMFRFAIVPRVQMTTFEDHSITYRLSYNELGGQIILTNPFGVGIGNQVLYGVRSRAYHEAGLRERWEWQPIHNIYLLMTAEIGIQGLAAFVLLLVIVARHSIVASTKHIVMRYNRHTQTLFAVFAGLSGAYLLFGMADHFFWDLHTGALLLWLALSTAAHS